MAVILVSPFARPQKPKYPGLAHTRTHTIRHAADRHTYTSLSGYPQFYNPQRRGVFWEHRKLGSTRFGCVCTSSNASFKQFYLPQLAICHGCPRPCVKFHIYTYTASIIHILMSMPVQTGRVRESIPRGFKIMNTFIFYVLYIRFLPYTQCAQCTTYVCVCVCAWCGSDKAGVMRPSLCCNKLYLYLDGNMTDTFGHFV